MPELTKAEIALQKKYAELRKKKEQQKLAQSKQNATAGTEKIPAPVSAVDKAKALLAKKQAATPKENKEKDTKASAPSQTPKEDPIAAAKRALEAKKNKSTTVKRPSLKRPARAPSKPKTENQNQPPASQTYADLKANENGDHYRQNTNANENQYADLDGDFRSNKRHKGLVPDPDEIRPTTEHMQGEATIFVGDLPPFHSKEDLFNTFSHFGPVDHIKLVREQCYAFIRFDCKATAQYALKCCAEKPLVLAGHELRVNESYGTLAEWKRQTPGGTISFQGEHPKVSEARKQGELIADALEANQMLQSHGLDMYSRPQERQIIAYDDL